MHHTQDSELEITSSLKLLEPGMYLFRYASKLSAEDMICFTLQATPLGKGMIDFFPAEGVSRNTLAKLGDCIVGRVKGANTGVLITEYRQTANPELRADLRIDRIDTSEAIISSQSAQPARTVETCELRIAGHVERIGDTVAQGGWLGSPSANSRIEGFVIEWPDRPDGVDIAYQCYVAGIGQQPPTLSGGYVGTRRQAAPITAVAFALVGPNAESYHLEGTVIFAGSFACSVMPGEELRGPTGREPLVAMQLSVFPSSSRPEIAAPRSTSPWDSPEVLKTNGSLG